MNARPTHSGLLDDTDRRIIAATQEGLPLVSRPYDAIGKQLDLPASEVKDRITALNDRGIIRRIGIVPNHYRLGYTANGMSVWDVDDEHVDDLGELVGALDFVSHCYKRPRHLPDWPYNLFAMVHGKTRSEVEEKIEAIKGILLGRNRRHDILYSTRILKKTGIRLSRQDQT